LFFDLKEVEEYVYRRGLAKISIEDSKRLDEGPAIRV